MVGKRRFDASAMDDLLGHSISYRPYFALLLATALLTLRALSVFWHEDTRKTLF